MKIYYLYNSGFAIDCGDTLVAIDYYRDRCEGERSIENGVITPEFLKRFKRVFALASHSHPDHFNRVIYNWAEYAQVTYILSSDIIPSEDVFCHSIAPGQSVSYGDFKVSAFGSTDIGVSFDITLAGMRLFHAGDFNFWHWEEYPNVDEAYVANAQSSFENILETLTCFDCDIAFFPLDERLGKRFDAGANMFIERMSPKLIIPMHFCNNFKKLEEYKQTTSVPVWAISRRGDFVEVGN